MQQVDWGVGQWQRVGSIRGKSRPRTGVVDLELHRKTALAARSTTGFLAGCALCIALCSSACMAQNGLVADYTFSEGSGTALNDVSGNGNDGVIHGARWVKAGSGHALYFNGKDSYVDCGQGPALDLRTAGSIEAWVRPYCRPSGEVGVVGKFYTSFLLTLYRDGGFYWYAGGGGNNVCGPSGREDSWHHLVGTFDGKELKIYVDGQMRGAKPSSVSRIDSGGKLYLGRVMGDPESVDKALQKSGYFNGMIGRVRVYNRPLSADEVQSRFVAEEQIYVEDPSLMNTLKFGQSPIKYLHASSWSNAHKAIMISDMGKCAPTKALSNLSKKKHWQRIPYQLGSKKEPGTKGTMIWASMETNAPTLRLPLGVEGCYAIYTGLYTSSFTPSKAWLSLDGDMADVPLRAGPSTDYWAIEEIFYRVADLTASSKLHISQQNSALCDSVWRKYNLGCGVAYVKLILLSEEETASFHARKGQRSSRRLAVTCDGTSFLGDYRPTTKREVLREIEFLRDTDFDTMLLHIGGSIQVAYATKVGEQFGQGMDDYPDVNLRYIVEACRELQSKGVNPTKVIIDGAHETGVKVHVGFRPALWGYYGPFDQFFRTKFFNDHPQWRTVDRDGTPVSRMSWAFPQVRKRQIDVLAEAVSFGADGAHIVFNRAWPVVLYEQPFIDMFKKQYGVDPRNIDETDPRIFKVRSDIVTTFIREVRAMLDREEKFRKNGKRLELSLCVMSNEYDNMQFGLDIRRLVDEGLIDELYPSYHPSFGAVKATWDGRFFLDVCTPKKIPVIPIYSSGLVNEESMASWAKTTLSLYEEGFSGVGLWDPSYELGFNKYRLLPLTRFGHTEELKSLSESGLPGRVYAPIYILGDKVMDQRYLPTWGG
ncbi:MAG: hypothetical protein HY318_15675 [Armatimonadetes bacterium]|nr:hypothetical protein [Armatimonadota bacterium]